MDRIDTATATAVLTAVLQGPGASSLSGLAEVLGVDYDPGRSRSFLRAAVPPTLTVGDWAFTDTGSGNSLEVRHTVRGVVLSRAVQPAPRAAFALAAALAELAEQQGPEAALQVRAWLGSWAELLGPMQ